MKVSFMEEKGGQILDSLNAMIKRGKSSEDYLDRVVWRQYQKAQTERWMTENESQGDLWKRLSPQYAKYKPIKYQDFPGSGSKLMIATGKLSQSAMGRDTQGFQKIVSARSLEVSINLGYVPYAGFASEIRPTMKFSDDTLRSWHKGLVQYVFKGVDR